MRVLAAPKQVSYRSYWMRVVLDILHQHRCNLSIKVQAICCYLLAQAAHSVRLLCKCLFERLFSSHAYCIA